MSRSIDSLLLLCWVAILALGAVMVASASVAISDTLMLKHGVYLAAALAGLAFVLCVPMDWWRRGHRLAWLGAVVLCVLVLVPGIGLEANGARRWIGLGAFSLQAAEVCKFLLLIYMAGYLERFHEGIKDDAQALLRPLLMLGSLCALLLLQPDFGTAVVLAVTTCGLLFVAGARLRHFLAIVAVGVALLGALAIVQPYRLERLVTFVDPWQFAFGSGYQLTQALIAFGRGEIFGLGLGEGIQKLFYLPEAHNDFIFAVIAEELGLVGALTVLALFALLVVRILRLGRAHLDGGDAFGGYLAYGVGLILGVQCLINIGVNTGMLPTKGLTLPFVSYGGNSLVVSCAMIGLLVRLQMEGLPKPKGGRRG
ncbi:MAG: putative lipid II flippase FtsW [Gammaproteobacteria bacterium]|jgi:cell division protein FtsW|nr:putative lipid II flippase FtsW [Gammaproteobacteria bacterium]